MLITVSVPTKRFETNISTISGIKSSAHFCLAAHCKDEFDGTQDLTRVQHGQPSSEKAHSGLVWWELAVRGFAVAVALVEAVLLVGYQGFLGRFAVLANIISVVEEHGEY